MGNLNFQDVIRDVHDAPNHALQISGTIQAAGQATVSVLNLPTVYVGTPTLFAVVNTSAAGDSTANIGFATVAISNPTLFAVVNTGAVGITNSIVTVANPNFGINAGVNGIGFATVNVANTVPTTLSGNVTLSDSKTYIGLTTATIGSMPSVLASGQYFPAPQSVASGALSPLSVDATGGVILANSNKYIGLASVSGTVGLGTGTLNIGSVSVLGGVINANLNAGVAGIGFATVNVVNQPALVASSANIGSVSVLGGSIALSAGLANVGFATVAVSTPTLFAVVNTSAAGTTDVTSNSGVTVYQGDASWTVDGTVAVTNAGLTELASAIDTEVQVDVVGSLPAGVNYIGFATVNQVNQPALIASTANIGSVSVLGGGIGLNAGLNNIGFATVAISTPTLFAVVNAGAPADPGIYIGLVTATVGNNPVLGAGVNGIGFATVNVVNQPALVASSANIGSVSVLGGSIKLDTNTLNIGSVSVLGGTINAILQTSTLNIGSVSILGGSIVNAAGVNGIGFVTAKIDSGTQFIGLVTSISRNAGTTKTLIPLPVGLGQNSLATVAVPTNANKINLTQLILNSNVTTEIAIKSGVTYLTGNASLGVTLFPGGGFVMNGSPDSPAWIGLPSGAMVVEKRDAGGTVSKIGGNVIYFDE